MCCHTRMRGHSLQTGLIYQSQGKNAWFMIDAKNTPNVVSFLGNWPMTKIGIKKGCDVSNDKIITLKSLQFCTLIWSIRSLLSMSCMIFAAFVFKVSPNQNPYQRTRFSKYMESIFKNIFVVVIVVRRRSFAFLNFRVLFCRYGEGLSKQQICRELNIFA